jgi:hypothetical protein
MKAAGCTLLQCAAMGAQAGYVWRSVSTPDI